MLPPIDATHIHHTTWVDMQNWHHGSIIMSVGPHQNPIYFGLKKGIAANLTGKNKNSSGVALKPYRFWSNLNSDGTATTHFTLRGNPSHDSTINARSIHVGSQHDDMIARGETYLVDIDSNILGENSSGVKYDCFAVKVYSQGAPPSPSGIGLTQNSVAVFAILSEPRYAGRVCTGAEGRVATED